MNVATPFLEVEHLSASFNSLLGELEALDDVTLHVRRGEFICVIGPSGCGKSTLLRVIAGLVPPAAGEIRLEGKLRWGPSSKVGLVFQQPTLLPWRTVRGNIALPLEMQGRPPQEITERTTQLLTQVGLNGFAEEYPTNLSGGMAQRTALARALAQSPEVLLLDEPFGALDALTREYMAAELLRIWERDQRTVVMVTHSVEEAALLADRVVVLSQRPAHVICTLPVHLPRPRTPAMLSSPALQEIARELRLALGGVAGKPGRDEDE